MNLIFYCYRLARMDAAGLLDKWIKEKLLKAAAPCLRKIDQEISNSKIKEDNKKRLTLVGLSGAFLVLGIGYSVAIAAFVVEVVHGYMRKREQNRVNDNKLNVEVPRRPRLTKDRKGLKVKNAVIEIKSKPLVGQSKVTITKETEDKAVAKNVSELGNNPPRIILSIQKPKVEVSRPTITKKLENPNAIEIAAVKPVEPIVDNQLKVSNTKGNKDKDLPKNKSGAEISKQVVKKIAE